MLRGRRVLIGIGGGIAAYKYEVVSTLFGAEVRVILTTSAQKNHAFNSSNAVPSSSLHG